MRLHRYRALLLGLSSPALALAQEPPAEEAPPPLPFEAEPPPAPAPAATPAEPAPAAEAPATTSDETVIVKSPRERARELGLNPGTPRAPGGVGLGPGGTSVGAALEPNWAFQFHGYLSAPL